MFGALSLGVALAFVSSMPLGPINLHLLRTSIQGQGRRSAAFVCGVVGADLLIAALAVGGLRAADLPPPVLRSIGAAGGLLLLGYAAIGLQRSWRRTSPSPPAEPTRLHLSSSVLMGVAFCGLNPGFYLFWGYGASLLAPMLPAHGAMAAVSYLVGVLAGDLLWFLLLLALARRLRGKLPLRPWSIASFVLVALIGLYALGRSLA